MSIFQGAKHVTITGGTQIAAGAGSTIINQSSQPGPSGAFKDLSAAAAHAALHNSSARFDAPRCHRNTRSTYLGALERWMLGYGEEYDTARVIWLNGGAGAGKSAIMQTTVERCTQHAVILGTFFFSRADSSRDFSEVLIPTLAYQLARIFPAAMAVLEPIIQGDPLIFKASLETQAHEFLVRPLLYLAQHGFIDTTSPLRRVFVIDGLDECDDPQKQASIIHVVATVLCEHNVPICFLIASRPEMAISRAFQREKGLHSILASITLNDDAEATSDIRQFIEDSFLDIIDTHPLRNHIPSSWPNQYSIDRLAQKSSGHFIYASTAMKFISSTDEHPSRALQVIEGLIPPRTGNPFAELAVLYLHILTSANYSSQVLAILRHCIFTCLDNSIRAVCFMNPTMTPEDVVLFLADVQPLVSLTPDDTGEMWISLKHASLSDFLEESSRSHAIYVNHEEYLASLLPRYFHLFDTCYHLTTPLFFSKSRPLILNLMHEFTEAIAHSQDIELLGSLIGGYPLQNVWNFFKGCKFKSNCGSREGAIEFVSSYLRTIRDSAANHDNTLYIHQFKIFIDILMDDLNDLVLSEPQYRIIPALLFSSSPRFLAVEVPFLITSILPLNNSYCYFVKFWCLQPDGVVDGAGEIDPRSYQAIRSLPQTQLSWSSDLATVLKLVLRQLMGYSWTPECSYPSLHKRWLRRMKPWKHISQGSPKLSSIFYSHIQRLPIPKLVFWPNSSEFEDLTRYGFSGEHAENIARRREQCFVLLKTVICYLYKCDCTSDLARLARKSLPKAALWFPGLMKRARAQMDDYVLRWEESPDGILERCQSLSIDEMD